MPSAKDFRPVAAVVTTSPDVEVLVAKQAALVAHSHEVRASLQQLEPGLASSLLAKYEPPSPTVVRDIALAVAEHESLAAALEAGGGLELEDGQIGNPDLDNDFDLSAEDPWIAQQP